MAEDRDAGLEAGGRLDPVAERLADALLGQPDVSEGVGLLLGLADQRRLQVGHPHALGHDDDAEILAIAATAVEVADHLVERHWKLRDDDQVGAAGKPPDHRHPTGVPPHDLDHHHPVVR